MKHNSLIKHKKKRGFTLVELMVVLAVIATITFIAVPNFTSIKNNVNEKVDRQSCEAIKRVITTFIVDETIDVSNITSFTYNAKDKEISNSNLDSKIKDALSDVKSPKTGNDKLYEISIIKDNSNTNGTNVSVMVSGNNNTKTD